MSTFPNLLRRIMAIMPTLPPPPMPKAVDEMERLARQGAVAFINDLCEHLYSLSYSTRSHMPADLDFTEFTDALAKLRKFCKARPDWAAKILASVMPSDNPDE